MRVYELVIEPDREDHIAVHGVRVEEVEEVVYGEPLVRRTRDQRYLLVGQTEAGRYLSVIIGPRGGGVYGLVTARDSTNPERRQFQQRRGT